MYFVTKITHADNVTVDYIKDKETALRVAKSLSMNKRVKTVIVTGNNETHRFSP